MILRFIGSSCGSHRGEQFVFGAGMPPSDSGVGFGGGIRGGWEGPRLSQLAGSGAGQQDQFVPQLGGNVPLGEFGCLGNAAGIGHAYNRGRDAWIPGGELQRRGGQGHIVRLAQLRGAP